MNFSEVVELYRQISTLYGKEPLGNEEIKLLAEVYREYTAAEIQRALQEHLRKKAFAPKPADLIKTVENNRREYAENRAAEARKQIKYDSNGRRIYKCPFCHDSGYMLVKDSSVYSSSAAKCICGNPVKSLEYRENGKVYLRLKDNHHRFMCSGYYVFDSVRAEFVPETEYLPPEPKRRNGAAVDIDDIGNLFDLGY